MGNTLHISTNNLTEGKYAVALYSLLGKKVFATTIDGKSNAYNLNIGKQTAGQYSLVISSEAKIISTTTLQVK